MRFTIDGQDYNYCDSIIEDYIHGLCLIEKFEENLNKVDPLYMFEYYFEIACTSYAYAAEKTRAIKICSELFNKHSVIRDNYIKTDAYLLKDRFVKKENEFQTIKNKFDDGIDYTAYNIAGLYFIGETHFNPFTKEEFYWVKIGKSTNLKKRMNQYNTCCPMLWRIDFSGDYDKEEYYHNRLYKECIATCNHNEEWFLVDKKTYLEMCEKGFSYFN